MDAIRYHFNHLVDESGLLHWGGHKFINLKTLEDVGPKEKGYVHELKNCFPYYELMRSEEHTSELQSRGHLVCRLLLEKKNTIDKLHRQSSISKVAITVWRYSIENKSAIYNECVVVGLYLCVYGCQWWFLVNHMGDVGW